VAKRNVALVYHFFAHYRQPVLQELLEKSKHRFLLCADTKNALLPGVKVWTPQDATSFRECRCFALRNQLLWQSGLIALALDRSLDAIVYLGDWKWPSTWLSAVIARLRGKRILFWTHGWRGRDRGLVRPIRKLFYRLADGLLLYGNWAKQVGIDEGFSARDLYVVYNSIAAVPAEDAVVEVPVERRRELRSVLFPESLPETPVVCCAGRLDARRRLDLLLDAASQLGADGHPVNVLLIGDGPERGRLEELARALGLGVEFIGACYDENRLAEYFSISNVTVTPGDIGLTAMHSMFHGIPVISHSDLERQLPEAEVILPDETGDFYQRGDRADLAKKIRKWTQTAFVNPAVSRACRELIRQHYAPAIQRQVIDAAIEGESAEAVAARLAEVAPSGRERRPTQTPVANEGR
jgi:glycosyltransferase involved in cell wall biosynthesis